MLRDSVLDSLLIDQSFACEVNEDVIERRLCYLDRRDFRAQVVTGRGHFRNPVLRSRNFCAQLVTFRRQGQRSAQASELSHALVWNGVLEANLHHVSASDRVLQLWNGVTHY